LFNAASNGDYGVIEGLIKAGADLNLIDKDDCTPLCVSIRECHVEVAKILIDAGADVNKGGGVYGSPLHMAIFKNDVILTD